MPENTPTPHVNLIPGIDVEPGFTVINYSDEIEAEVDAIYEEIYDEQTAIDKVVALLQRRKPLRTLGIMKSFRTCSISYLTSTRSSKPTTPLAKSAKTGYLFGSIIHHEVVYFILFGMALRCVVDALNCPPGTNLFRFGLEPSSGMAATLSSIVEHSASDGSSSRSSMRWGNYYRSRWFEWRHGGSRQVT
jgi:CCR4-NOT transcription complex subunit 1